MASSLLSSQEIPIRDGNLAIVHDQCRGESDELFRSETDILPKLCIENADEPQERVSL